MQSSKRGQRVALAGLALQLALVGLAVGLWLVTSSPVGLPAVWLTAAPLLPWVLTALLFHCRYLKQREAEEMAELAARAAAPEGIFAGEGEVLPAAHRLEWMERYVVPTATLLIAGYHLALGIWMFYRLGGVEFRPTGATAPIFFAVGGAFAAFLFSRYATGMAKVETWSLLRAPGSYMFVNALALVLELVALALEHYGVVDFGPAAGYILAALMVVVGFELVLNFVLDLYRPRVPGVERRVGYDSRLLNLVASPERVGHSIAEAINYQFGFEVSKTWFYQLLQRAFVPLVLTGVVVVWLLTGVVVVEEGDVYVVLHWGKRYPERVLRPRRWPYLVCPWPIDKARRFRAERVQELLLGVGGERQQEMVNGRYLYLWAQEHGKRQELDILVAKPPSERQTGGKQIPAVNVIKFIVSVQYRITDPYRFGYAFRDAAKLLEDVAYREMTLYAASATLDEPIGGEAGRRRPQGIMSFGRQQAERDLHRNIAEAVRKLDLGVEIVRVQVLGSHPPPDAAGAFQRVIAAEREQDKLRYEAQAEANRLLSAAAGNPDGALRLAQAIEFRRDLDNILNARQTGGDVAGAVAEAIQRCRSEIANLNDQIQLERLLRRNIGGQRSIAEELLQRQQRHLKLLKKIAKDPAKAPLAQYLAQTRRRVDALFATVGGQAAVEIAKARAYRWRAEFTERARAEAFPAHVLAARAAPRAYRMEKYLEVLAEALADPKKYILGLDRDRLEVWLNLEEPPQVFSDIPLGKKESE